MGKVYERLDPALIDFISRQKLFFVATAPLEREGRVNLSPKGLDTFRVLGPLEVAYLDLTGSGIETIAHLKQNGRITMLFSAFEGPPRILRLYGEGQVLEPGHGEYAGILARFPQYKGARAVIRVQLTRIGDSCGYAVPRYKFAGDRTKLEEWAENKGPDGLKRYRCERNARSLDGLPGLGDAGNF